MGLFDWEPVELPEPPPPPPEPEPPPPVVLPLQELCWRVIQKGITCSNVLELMNFMEQFNLPGKLDVRAHCMRYVERAYATLRLRRGVAEMQEMLEPGVFALLEDAIARTSEEAKKKAGILGRVVEAEAPAEECRQDVPSVTGHPHSYRLAGLVAGVKWPVDVDTSNRERHMGHDEFLKTFGVTYAAYLAKPDWKKRVMKQDANLF